MITLESLLSGVCYDSISVSGSTFSLIHKMLVKGIALHSNDVCKGGLFAAFSGKNLDGVKYIEDAVSLGAQFILCDREYGRTLPIDDNFSSEFEASLFNIDNIVYILCDNPRKVFSRMVKNYCKIQGGYLIGVTGTNGKSSVVDFLRQLWHISGKKCASIGTLGVMNGGELYKNVSERCLNNQSHMTTPDVVSLNKTIKNLLDKNTSHLALEVSSHGLDQYRVDNIKYKVACFTNLSQDHLDYHENMSNYLQAKLRFFEEVIDDNTTVVINYDSPQCEKLQEVCKSRGLRQITYGVSEQAKNNADISGEVIGYGVDFQLINIKVFEKHFNDIKLPVIGDFQLYNVLCAIAGLIPEVGVDGIEFYISQLVQLKNVTGRLELAGTYNEAGIYVDFAHTPEGLNNVLRSLRKYSTGKLKILFGCGGQRDKTKRPIMGHIACELADEVFVTDDNPREEEPESIRKDIILGGIGSKMQECVAGRGDAIAQAIKTLNKGDVLLIAGKGHENTQILKNQVVYFNDSEIVKSFIN